MIIDRVQAPYNPLIPHQAQAYYKERTEDGDGLEFSDIAGGLGWPTLSEPGWLIVLGEHRSYGVGGRRPVRILEEVEVDEEEELLHRAVAVRKRLECYRLFGDTGDRGMMHGFYEFNMATGANLQLGMGLFADDAGGMGYALQLIKSRTHPGRKSLIFGEGSRVAQLLGVLLTSGKGERLNDVPWLAALTYGLAYFDKPNPQVYDIYERIRDEILDEEARVWEM